MANSLIDGDGKLNVRNYNEKVRKQRETFAQIDLATSILETLPDFVDTTMDVINANSFTFSTSPLGFIFNIIHSLGVSEETLKEWIVNILVRVLPEVEIGVKATLLANIKSMISCNADPRIPLWMRKKVSDSVYTNVLTGLNEGRGIDINLDVIDPEGTLDLSPFTEPGKNYYFGNNTLNNLVRADDFNAFLWYVIHKGNKHNPIRANTGTEDGWKTFNVSGDDTKYYITSSNSSMLGPLEIRTQQGEESNIVGGNTFYDSEGSANNISMCIEAKRNKQLDYNPKTGRIDNGIIRSIQKKEFCYTQIQNEFQMTIFICNFLFYKLRKNLCFDKSKLAKKCHKQHIAKMALIFCNFIFDVAERGAFKHYIFKHIDIIKSVICHKKAF
jgi:hypothetical protein